MARIVKEEAYAARRNEILDVAQQLVNTRGYEHMTIQDVLEGASISKGAFYHYFGSKQDLLEGLIERMLEPMAEVLNPVVLAPDLTAMEKFQRLFESAGRWKMDQKDFLLALLRVWYLDENALVRQKAFSAGVQFMTPLMAAIIRQGCQEGVFSATNPEQTAEAALYLMQGLNESLARLMLTPQRQLDDWRILERAVAAYSEALERVLGAAPGSITLIDAQTLQAWGELIVATA